MKNWSLKQKIVAILSIFILSNFVVLGMGLKQLSDADGTTDRIVQSLAARVALAAKLKYNQTLMALQIRDGVLEATADGTRAVMKRLESEHTDQEEMISAFGRIASEEGKAASAVYRKEMNEWYDTSVQLMEANANGRHEEAVGMLKNRTAPLRAKMAETLDGIVKLNADRMDEAAREANVQFEHAVIELLTISLVALLLGTMLATVVLSRLTRSIQNVIDTLQGNAEQVAAASSEIASSSEELSQAATEQAASLEETSSALEEISAMIGKSSENAGITASKSSESQAKAEEGRHAVEQMLASMGEISQSNEAIVAQVNASNQQMGEIVRVIREIGDKTKVINEIVFQTKLLSFNASVEAARAGDHGKGFAVVAEEVGNLAQMSGNAASEISEMLSSSIGKVEGIVSDTKSKVHDLTERGKRKVQNGVEVAQQCSVLLKDIVGNVTRVAGLAQEISHGSAEQSQGVGEINKAMAQLDSVTQQNASTSEEAASAAEELSAQAENLKDTVIELVRTVQGSDAADRVTTAAAPKARRASLARDNVVHLKKAVKPAQRAERAQPLKAAAGAGFAPVPSRDDEGFQDV